MAKLSNGEVRWSERAASRDRAMPSVPGMEGGQLTGEVSTDHWRTSDRAPQRAHRGSPHCKRFGVKPSGGKVADIYAGPSLAGQDDGSGYFEEFRASGGLVPFPAAKTAAQDRLGALASLWAQDEAARSREIAQAVMAGIETISRTDPELGSEWRKAAAWHGIAKAAR